MTSQPTRNLAKRLSPAVLVLAGVACGAIFSDAMRPSTALAQQASGDGMTNALEQRKQMITQLNNISDRLTRIENALNTGIKVKVTEMPPVTVKEPATR